MAVVATAQALLKEGVAKLVQLSGFSETQLVQLAVVAVIALGLVLLLNNVVATLRIPSIKVELTEGTRAFGTEAFSRRF